MIAATTTYTRFSSTSQELPFEQWEEVVLARHHILSRRLLVLGTGISRESIALAKRGFLVIGLDISRSALHMGAQIARTAGVPITFVQADFWALPVHRAYLDYILLPSIMYCSIPSRRWRQTWLRQLTSLLSPGGSHPAIPSSIPISQPEEKWSAKPLTDGSSGFQKPTASTSLATPSLRAIFSMLFKASRNCAKNCLRAAS